MDFGELLGWGSLDMDKLDYYLGIATMFDVDIEEIRRFIKDIEGDMTDINTWLFATVNCAFYAIMNAVRDEIEGDEELEEKIQELIDNFDPFINYMDTWFNNILDDVNFDNSKTEVIQEIIEKLKETS